MSRSVLVVDDDGDLRNLVRIALTTHDEFVVVSGESEDAATALDRCRELAPDLVVFTAAPTHVRQARSWGADDLVRKDADIGRLVHALERARPPERSRWQFPGEPASIRAARHCATDELRGLGMLDRHPGRDARRQRAGQQRRAPCRDERRVATRRRAVVGPDRGVRPGRGSPPAAQSPARRGRRARIADRGIDRVGLGHRDDPVRQVRLGRAPALTG